MYVGDELETLDEFLEHGRAVRAERQRAAAAGEAPDFVPLVRGWGGVTLAYRKRMVDSPAYRLNHEEIIKALEEGIAFAENLDPREIIADDQDQARAIVFEGPDGRVELPARTVLVAAGTVPNITYEKEQPRTFGLDAKKRFFQGYRAEGTGATRVARTGSARLLYAEPSGQYYLDQFLPSQPDLNWWNEDVRDAFDDILRFWFDRGVAGFRIDVCHSVIKDRELRDNPAATKDDHWYVQMMGYRNVYNACRPEVHDVLRRWRKLADSYDPPRVLIGETYVLDPDQFATFYGVDERRAQPRVQLHAHPLRVQRAGVAQGRRARRTASCPRTRGPRGPAATTTTTGAPSRWCGRRPGEGAPRMVMLMGLRGTPFLYYGDEIGMPDTDVPVERILDPVGKFHGKRMGRDEAHADALDARRRRRVFSTGVEPWLPYGDYKAINVADQKHDPDSMLSLTRDLIGLRDALPELRDGVRTRADTSSDDAWAWQPRRPHGRRVQLLGRAGRGAGGGTGQRFSLSTDSSARRRRVAASCALRRGKPRSCGVTARGAAARDESSRRIGIIGAGPGGLCAASSCASSGLHGVREGRGVGGVWWHNRTPVPLDVPSHLYSFSFELKRDRSRPYAVDPRSRNTSNIRREVRPAPRLRLDTRSRRALERRDRRLDVLATAAGDDHEFDVVVSAVGMFNDLVTPVIPGLDDFAGHSFHSARWDRDHDLTGEPVAVVGSAASAVQFVPEIAKFVGHLDLYQRTPNWVLPKSDTPCTGDNSPSSPPTPTRCGPSARPCTTASTTRSRSEQEDQQISEQMGRDNIALVEDAETRRSSRRTIPTAASGHCCPTSTTRRSTAQRRARDRPIKRVTAKSRPSTAPSGPPTP